MKNYGHVNYKWCLNYILKFLLFDFFFGESSHAELHTSIQENLQEAQKSYKCSSTRDFQIKYCTQNLHPMFVYLVLQRVLDTAPKYAEVRPPYIDQTSIKTSQMI